MFGRGPESAIYSQMHEATNDDVVRRYISRHFMRMQEITTAQELSDLPETEDPTGFLDALGRGQERALSALFRLAFEAGRRDERAEAAELNELLREE